MSKSHKIRRGLMTLKTRQF